MARKAQHAYDPKRRTRRHHYQERPGFLFVATQGGRPPRALPEASLRRVRERMRAVRLAREGGAADACRQTGCSRASLYRWIAAYDAHGLVGLQAASRRPHRLQPCVPAWVERVVITVRLLTYWNSKRIAAEMERRQIYRLGRDYIDDHSRLLLVSDAFVTVKAADVVHSFAAAWEVFGFPAALLTDNGAIFSGKSRKGKVLLESELERLGILGKHSTPYHPQTCGKVERFHQTLKRYLGKQTPATSLSVLQAQLDTFRPYYNQQRPHRALDGATPAACATSP